MHAEVNATAATTAAASSMASGIGCGMARPVGRRHVPRSRRNWSALHRRCTDGRVAVRSLE